MEDFCGLGSSYVDERFHMHFFSCDLAPRLERWRLAVSGGRMTMAQARLAMVDDVMERRRMCEVHSVGFSNLTAPGLEATVWTAQRRFLREWYGHRLSTEPLAP